MNYSQLRTPQGIVTIASLIGIFLAGLTIGDIADLSRFIGNNWPPPNGILASVKKQGHLRCAINGSLPGFSIGGDPAIGLDADFCKVIAVAIFGEIKSENGEERVVYLTTDVNSRFDIIENGKADVLFRNTTWTAGRDLGRKVDFGPPIFYDGQGFLIRKPKGDSPTISIPQPQLDYLKGKSICVLPSTTTSNNLQSLGIDVNIVQMNANGEKFTNNREVFKAYDELPDLCDAVTADWTQIAVFLQDETVIADSAKHIPLNILISKEPLAPVYVEGDPQWREIIDYAVYATIQAAELNITSENIEKIMTGVNISLSLKKFLGIEDEIPEDYEYIGKQLGLDVQFVQHIIKEVGNYEEIYDRNLGSLLVSRSDLSQETDSSYRGLNEVWSQTDKEGFGQIWTNDKIEGLLFSPQFE